MSIVQRTVVKIDTKDAMRRFVTLGELRSFLHECWVMNIPLDTVLRGEVGHLEVEVDK